MAEVSLLIWGVCLYGLLLTGVGWAFDLTAKHASARALRMRNPGFSYHESHDAWLCPEDQWLWPTSFDPDNRVMRYRAKPSVCNSCPVRSTCTTSTHGKQVTRELDQWPHSETGRFHRGIALAVVAMGLVMVLAGLLMAHTMTEYTVLATTALVVLVCAAPLVSHLRATPSHAPEHVVHLAAPEALLEASADRFAAKWGGHSARGVNSSRWDADGALPSAPGPGTSNEGRAEERS